MTTIMSLTIVIICFVHFYFKPSSILFFFSLLIQRHTELFSPQNVPMAFASNGKKYISFLFLQAIDTNLLPVQNSVWTSKNCSNFHFWHDAQLYIEAKLVNNNSQGKKNGVQNICTMCAPPLSLSLAFEVILKKFQIEIPFEYWKFHLECMFLQIKWIMDCTERLLIIGKDNITSKRKWSKRRQTHTHTRPIYMFLEKTIKSNLSADVFFFSGWWRELNIYILIARPKCFRIEFSSFCPIDAFYFGCAWYRFSAIFMALIYLEIPFFSFFFLFVF